ncbi:hypothetical protein GCM10009733_097890 [Nonomuraea maheshkhaliensis]|uniref:Uncharacterized protein n=1 Tax=Nonomuraea maheshkhaliensis TaxID=419590 RepID=A0ABP4TCN3_9ACTN
MSGVHSGLARLDSVVMERGVVSHALRCEREAFAAQARAAREGTEAVCGVVTRECKKNAFLVK